MGPATGRGTGLALAGGAMVCTAGGAMGSGWPRGAATWGTG